MSSHLSSLSLSRRRALGSLGALSAVIASGVAPSLLAAEPPSRRVRLAVIGLGRGLDHVQAFLQVPNVELVAVCDVDERRVAAAIKRVEERGGKAPKGVRDFRRLLEDRELDAVSIAMPNFWHAPATLMACAAGKHVYVEKPGSHNLREGEWMLAAARRHQRHVQMGNQRRSMPIFRQAMEELHRGAIGKLTAARCWYDASRPSIGRGKPAPVPSWLDYSLWQGPIPERPYVDNLVHYNWHWRWHWGGGELANNGIHTLDLARWGLGVNHPTQVTCTGGRYHFDDDQETPDTQMAVYHFGSSMITWDGSSCHPRKEEAHPLIRFYGEGGTLSLEGDHYLVHDLQGKLQRRETGSASDLHHFSNFIDSIRDNTPLNSEIEVGQLSTRLCHLGNLAWRTRSVIEINPATGLLRHPTPEMKKAYGREYGRAEFKVHA